MRQAVKDLFDELSQRGEGLKTFTENWLNEPEWKDCVPLQASAAMCPPDKIYTVRRDAPYLTSRPGCIGVVMGYLENGECIFAMHAPAKGKPMMRRRHEGDGEIIPIFNVPIPLSMHIKPEHLRPITREEAEELEVDGADFP